MAAMSAPSLWERLRTARVVQVLFVYLGASWAVLQIAETFTDALSLPEWVIPVAILLLLVGMVIILATAWVQSLPSTTAAEEAGERPTDWQVAPAQALQSLKKGRLPYLTWGRAIMGGVVALSMLFGGAGAYVLLTGGQSFVGPTEAGASGAAEGIAVLPFNVSGVDDTAFWGEGMVDLLSTNLDGMGGYRTIDARTVLARWRETVGDDGSADLDAALAAAGETGARYAVVGSAVGIGSNLRLVTEVYDLADGSEVGSGQVEGSADDPMALIDDISLETVRALLSGGGQELATGRNLADLTTSSLPALRAYLEGERYYRQAEFPQAVEAYERALQADSTFALALFRISDAYGWLEDVGSETAAELGARSVRHMDRLSPRNAVIVEAGNALYTGDMEIVDDLEAAVRKYPDDPEAWFMLGELYLHLGEATRADAERRREVIMRAIDLDPSFAPYYVHALDQHMVLGEVERAREILGRYGELSDAEELQTEYRVAFDLYFGAEENEDAAWQALHDLDDSKAGVLWGTFGTQMEDLVTSRRIAEHMRERRGGEGWTVGLARWSVMDGRLNQAEAMVRDSLLRGPDPRTVYFLHRFGRPQPDDLLEAIRDCEPGPACDLWAGALAAEEGDWDRHQAAVDTMLGTARQQEAAGDTLNARFPTSAAQALIGYGQLRRGDPARSRLTLDEAQGRSNGAGDQMMRLWLGEANEALERRQDAVRWYGLLMETHRDGRCRPGPAGMGAASRQPGRRRRGSSSGRRGAGGPRAFGRLSPAEGIPRVATDSRGSRGGRRRSRHR
jgi:TolB-like protein